MKKFFYLLIGGIALLMSCVAEDPDVITGVDNGESYNNSGNNDGNNGKVEDPIQNGSKAYGEYEMSWIIDGLGTSKGTFYAQDESGITNQFYAYIDPQVGLPQELMKLSYPVKADSICTFLGPRLKQPYNSMIRRKFVGYSEHLYCYSIAIWQFVFDAFTDKYRYIYQPLIDTDKSTMYYDVSKEHWSGAIMVNQIQVYRSELNSQVQGAIKEEDMGLYKLKTPLVLLFNTTKKVK